MNDKRACSACGVKLPSNAPSELCVACLLKAGLPDGKTVKDSGPGGTIALDLTLTEKPGEKIGHYKLLQQIGEGGCGVVYMAEQQEPVKRRVALKVIKLGMDTKEVVGRFEAERQALALMDHPNIAKVFDAGATENGRAFFVMELVKGIPITRYCDENKLDTKQRLDLFIQVCQAIQHAHQKGIIHRDIKPSNILVADHDGVGVPKIIDFGIAKATAGQTLTDKTVFTAFEQFIGTPAYMSPEQAKLSGLDIDTRSDIYSLGVLLYELLTGRTPFDAKRLFEAGFDEIRRIIREEEPPRPSTKLSTLDAAEQTAVAVCRHSEPPKLLGLIRGDLDWIVMKTLEKDRNRRYETANGLARDIQRYLNNEPVAARPPSNLYRFQKVVRRNKLAFGAVAAVAMSLVLGLGFSTYSWIQAEAAKKAALREAEKNRQITDLMAYIDLSIITRIPASQRRGIAPLWDEAAKIFDREEVRSQPDVEAHLRMIFGATYGYLGEDQKCQYMLRRVLELRPKIGDANQAVAYALLDRGWPLFLGGQFADAEKTYRQALRSAKASGAAWIALGALTALGEILFRRGDFAGAEIMCRESLAIHRKSLALIAHRGCRKSDCYAGLLEVLHLQGKHVETEQLLGEASKELTELECREMLDALVRYCTENGLWKDVAFWHVELEPENPDYYHALAPLLVQSGDVEGYRRHCARVLAHFGATPDPVIAERMAKDCLIIPMSGADLDTLAKMADLAVTAGKSHPYIPYFQFAKGLAEYRQGSFSSAAEWMRRVLESRDGSWRDAQAYSLLAMTQQRLGQTDAALGSLAEGSRIIDTRGPKPEASGGGDWIMTRALRTEAEKLLQVDRPEQAAKLKQFLAEAPRKLHREQAEQYRKAAEGGEPQALNALAWFLATCSDAELRDGPTAVGLAEKAVRATDRKDAMILDTLAAAYAETGQFPKAISTQKEAIALPQNEQQRRELISHLKLFESNSPYHEPD
jgi:serine/threonine protein kinase/Flp pilus assembly protein TadD